MEKKQNKESEVRVCMCCYNNNTNDDKKFVRLDNNSLHILCEDCIQTCSGLIAKIRRSKPKLIINNAAKRTKG